MTPQTTLAGPWPEFVFIPQPQAEDAFKLKLAAAKKANTSERILAFVESNPGTQATFIAEALGCKYKTTASKISVMEKQNLLISKKSDLYGLNNRPVKQYWAKGVGALQKLEGGEAMNTAQRIASHQKRMNLIGRNPVFQAIARSPMKQSTQSTQAIDARLSFDAISKGQGDHYDHHTMDSLTRLVHLLALEHCSDADQQTAMDAKAAVKRAQNRFADGKAWNFDAPGRLAVMAAMDMFEQMAQTLGRGAITTALIEIIEQGDMQ